MKHEQIQNIRELYPLAKENFEATKQLAKEFIAATAWWHSHSSGRPVRAPKHADRIYESSHGFTVDFGANSFLAGEALTRCSKEICNYLKLIENGQKPDTSELKTRIQKHIQGAVSNYDGIEYEVYYPVTGSDMMFGVQSIDIDDGLNFILDKSGLNTITLP